jgi:hypothetical protein
MPEDDGRADGVTMLASSSRSEDVFGQLRIFWDLRVSIDAEWPERTLKLFEV